MRGPRGTLVKDLKHIPIDMQLSEDGKKIKIDRWFVSGKAPASIRTACSHIENCIKGVTIGYEYKMRFVYAHFPINFTIDKSGQKCEIRNFLGEKVVRRITMLGDTIVSKNAEVKDEINIEGIDVDLVGRSSALINQSCLVKRKDIRKFLAGIYVSARGVKGRQQSI